MYSPDLFIITNSLDRSSSNIIPWLRKNGNSVSRINIDQPFDSLNWAVSEIANIQERPYIVWLRSNFSPLNIGDTDIEKKLYSSLKNEALYSYLFQIFDNANKILGPQESVDKYFIKLKTLKLCKEFDISVPKSAFISEKKNLVHFLKENGRIISKTTCDVISIKTDLASYKTFTKEILSEQIERLSDQFWPSFFQKLIEKKFEVKAVYLDGSFYASGIHIDNSNNVDFRTEYTTGQIRYFPINLPYQLREKVKLLMGRLNLNFGIIDFVVGTDEEYYFLEVNPFGQFENIMNACNYYIESKIAKWINLNLKKK